MIVPILIALSASAPPPLEAPEEHVEVQRVLLPVRLTPARNEPHACDNLRADEIHVFEDGRPARRIEAIDDAGSRPTLHVLLLDDKGCRTGHLKFEREFAARYIDNLKPDDSAAILVSDDDLILHCPPTTDHDRLGAATRSVVAVSDNLTWDNIEQTVRQFAGRRERKVLVLVADGVDFMSLGTFREALGAASSDTNLSIFPIYPDRPDTWRDGGGPEGAVAKLKSLAEATGGKFFTVDDASSADQIATEIHAILGREVIVDYEPPSTEKSREDGFHEIKITLDPARRDCHAEASRPDRYAGPVDLSAPGLVEPLWKSIAQSSGFLRDETCRSGAFLHEGAGSIDGCTLDALEDYGLWFDPAETDAFGFRYHPVLALRRFVIPVPPLERLASTPGEVVLRWLVNDLPSSYPVSWASAAKGPDRIPLTLAGRAWLALRVRLGGEIFEHFEPYAAWLKAKLKREAPPSVDPAEAELRAANPSRWDIADNLAAWLGDISAHDLGVQVERETINLLLGGRESDRDEFGRVMERWDRLKEWFPPPLKRRVVGLPEPVLDPVSGKIGFYRVELDHTVERGTGLRVRSFCGPVWFDELPEFPAAILLARNLWSDSRSGSELRQAGVRIESVEDQALSRKEIRRLQDEGTLKDVHVGPSRSVSVARIRVSIPERGGRTSVTYSGWVVGGGKKPPEIVAVRSDRGPTPPGPDGQENPTRPAERRMARSTARDAVTTSGTSPSDAESSSRSSSPPATSTAAPPERVSQPVSSSGWARPGSTRLPIRALPPSEASTGRRTNRTTAGGHSMPPPPG